MSGQTRGENAVQRALTTVSPLAALDRDIAPVAHSRRVDTGTYVLFSSFLAGSVRALLLWRASTSVEVVNVVVLSVLAEGRGKDLQGVLRGSGSAAYLDVAAAIGRSALELRADAEARAAMEAGASAEPEARAEAATERDPRQRLQHAAQAAILTAGKRLRRHAWLDSVVLATLAYAGIEAAMSASATSFEAVSLVAATLLWVANVLGARNIATRIYAGASALVDSVLASFENLPGFAAQNEGGLEAPS